jgi:hypothetical protein
MSRGRKSALLVFAGAILVLTACLVVYRDGIAVAYRVHRLKTGKETIRDILAEEPTPIEARSLDAFLGTPRGLEAVLKLLIEELGGREICGSGGVAGAGNVLLWLAEDGRLRMDVICGGSNQHSILDYRGEDPALCRRLRPFLSRAPRVEGRGLEESHMTISLLPFEEGAAIFAKWVHPEKAPRAREGAGTMAILLERAEPAISR